MGRLIGRSSCPGRRYYLSQSQIANLFGSTQQNVSFHIQQPKRKLDLGATHKKFLIVQTEG